MLLDAGSLARLGTLPVRARLLVQGALSGLHRAAHRGSSVEFAEHKQYSPGDEIRHIDWKVFAKQGRYFVKQFDQESQLTVYLVLDSSGSMNFSGGGAQKLEYAATLLACLAYLVGQQQDKIGLVVFGGTAPQVLPATGRITVRDIMAMLEATCTKPAAGNSGGGVALQKIAELNRRRRALIVFASDFFDPQNTTIPALRELRAMGHDVSVAHVLAPHELTFPYDGMTLFESLESEHKLLANPSAIRQEYLRKMMQFLHTCKTELVQAGIDYHTMQTNVEVESSLRGLLVARNALMRGRA
jgi:uncharacterized protein (DUF58 family)